MSLSRPTTPPTPTPAHGEYRSLPRRTAGNGNILTHSLPKTRRVVPASSLYSHYRNPRSDASLTSDVENALDYAGDSVESRSDEESQAGTEVESVLNESYLADDEDEVDADIGPSPTLGKKRTQPRESVERDEDKTGVDLGWARNKSKKRATENKPGLAKRMPTSVPTQSSPPRVVSLGTITRGITNLGTNSTVLFNNTYENSDILRPQPSLFKCAPSRRLASARRLQNRLRARKFLHAKITGGRSLTSVSCDPIADLSVFQNQKGSSKKLSREPTETSEMELSETGTKDYDTDVTMKTASFKDGEALSDANIAGQARTAMSGSDVSKEHLQQKAAQTMSFVSDNLKPEIYQAPESKLLCEITLLEAHDPLTVSERDENRLETLLDDSQSKARCRYEPKQPLSDKQVANLNLKDTSLAILQCLRPKCAPIRAAGQHYTRHLQRNSPTSLLPLRKLPSRLIYPFSKSDRVQCMLMQIKPGTNPYDRTPFPYMGKVMCGFMYARLFRARAIARLTRREAVKSFNERTKDGPWTKWVENYYFRELIPPVNKWWLESPKLLEEPAKPVHQPDRSPSTVRTDAVIAPLDTPEVDESLVSHGKRVREDSDDPQSDTCSERPIRRRTGFENDGIFRHCQSTVVEASQRARVLVQQETDLSLAATSHEEENRRYAQVRAAAEAERRRDEELQARAQEDDERIARETSLLESEFDEGIMSDGSVNAAEGTELQIASRSPSPVPTEVSFRSDPPEYDPPTHPLGGFPSRTFEPEMPFIRHVPHRSRPHTPPRQTEHLPSYAVYGWSQRTPSPPPPYNAQVDGGRLIAPRFVLDEGDVSEDEADYELSDRHHPGPSEPVIVGAFPTLQRERTVRMITPAPEIESARAFEAAIDLEEGEVVDGILDEEESDEQPVGTLQRMIRFFWGR
nr:hypothetical protein L203_04308 [Cryptococcus depauperatus CBS 7841]